MKWKIAKHLAQFYNTINEMKNCKAPGPDGISIEFYKRFWHVIGEQFTLVLNEILKGNYEYKEYKQAYITLIYKKSDPADIKNYRPISC